MTFSSRADGAADGAPSAIPLCFKYMLLFSFRDLTRGFSYPEQAAVFRTGAIFRIYLRLLVIFSAGWSIIGIT